jgi:hypothetical protein
MLLKYILQSHVEVFFHLQKEALNSIIASLAMLSCFDWPFEILVDSQKTPFHVDFEILNGESMQPRAIEGGESNADGIAQCKKLSHEYLTLGHLQEINISILANGYISRGV